MLVYREDCAGDRPRLQAGEAGKFVRLLIVTEVAWWIFQKGVIQQKNPKYLGILYCFTSWTQRLTILDATNLSDLTVSERKCLLISCSGQIPKLLKWRPIYSWIPLFGFFPRTYLGVPTGFSEAHMTRVELVYRCPRDVVAIHCKNRWRVSRLAAGSK